MNCPHCGHDWDLHKKQCADCGCYWPDPRVAVEPPEPESPSIPGPDYLYEGSISAADLYEAFWTAATATFNDETIFSMDMPYFDKEMDTVDGHMPPQFWGHMARALVSGY